MGEGVWGANGTIRAGRKVEPDHGRRLSDPGQAHLLAVARSEALPPKLSARTVPSWLQIAVLVTGMTLLALAYRERADLVVEALGFAAWLSFLLIVIWRFCLVAIGAFHRFRAKPFAPPPTPPGATGDHPVYSILIALRKEEGMMQQLARSLSALDWPKDRLDILLLTEVDDPETRSAALRAPFPAGTRILTVPEGTPLTKPRALNYGLAHAVGEYLTIYDAEDRPHPAQLQAAHQRFTEAPADVLCLQAPLTATNGAANWIAAHWALEYDVQFNLYLPALAALDYPVMLGGTSNHFRRSDLLAFGGWDAWNVTEDADLGLRAARLGGRTWRIAPPTRESAPERFPVWFRQRKRWIKGYMQTWLVCMRRPIRLLRELGIPAFISLQMTLGASIVSAFLYGPMTLWIVAGLLTPLIDPDPLSVGLFLFGWAVHTLGDLLAPGRWRFARLLAIATRPLYWPLQTGAAFVALYGLAVRPFFWAKTPHQPEEDASPRP